MAKEKKVVEKKIELATKPQKEDTEINIKPKIKVTEEMLAALTDEEIVLIAKEKDQIATEYLLNKYSGLVRSKAWAYFIMGGDTEDIIQEGLVGLFKAIRDFQIDKKASFVAFADICVTRQVISAIKAATRQKHIPLNSYVSLNRPLYDDESDRTLIDILGTDSNSNPETLMIYKEELRSMELKTKQVLSEFEEMVLTEHINGHSYQEIAESLHKEVKSIDNALQRIKRKLENSLNENDDY